MPSETTRVAKRWRHWQGTPDDIVRLARLAEKLLADAKAENTQARVRVEHQRGESSYDSAAEAAEHLSQVDLETVETVNIFAGDLWSGVSVVINMFRTGLLLRVEGTGDRHLAVAGIAADLTAELDRGDRSYPHERTIVWALLAVSMPLVVGSAVTTLAHTPRAISSAIAGLGILLALAVVWIVNIRSIFVPALELHRAGEQNRAERWFGKLRRFGAWAFTLVLGAVLLALIQRWLQ